MKLSQEEMPRVAELLTIPLEDDRRFATKLIQRFGLKLVSITRGAQGSLLASSTHFDEHPGFRVDVKDTVGSGDAFTAGLVHEYLHGTSLDLMNEVANLVGAWVASEVGAMPAPKRGALEHSLAEIR